jgi:YHS domain-containing protein
MTKATLASALAGAILLASGTAALAAVAGEFGNYCAMGLVNGDKKITDCSISEKIDGKTYCFHNNTHKEEFMKDPAANIDKAQAAFSGQ